MGDKSIGFHVKRYHHDLYITSITDEERIKPGYKIKAIDNVPITILVESKRRFLASDIPERENWQYILARAQFCTLEDRNGIRFNLELKKYIPKKSLSEYILTTIDEETLFLKMNDFMDGAQLKNLIINNQPLFALCKNLIIDVRVNSGGMDSVYQHLLNYIFPPDSVNRDDPVYHLITDRNYKNRMKLFKELQHKYGEDKSIRQFIINMDLYKDKGFCEFKFEMDQDANIIAGSKSPINVIILIDNLCGSSGDQFALTASQSPKVTLIGRPTSGRIDYSNLAIEYFEEINYRLLYPTSKSSRIDLNEGIDNSGVQPDIYIPWTPDHIEVDVDLRGALQYIKRLSKV